MPRIEIQKENKSQKYPTKANMYQNKVLNHISTRLPKFFSVRELKIKYISHTKGHYGQRSLNKNSERKVCRRTQQGQKGPKAQKVQNGMEMRNK